MFFVVGDCMRTHENADLFLSVPVVVFCICFLCVMSLAAIRAKAGCGDAADVRYSFVLLIVFVLFGMCLLWAVVAWGVLFFLFVSWAWLVLYCLRFSLLCMHVLICFFSLCLRCVCPLVCVAVVLFRFCILRRA